MGQTRTNSGEGCPACGMVNEPGMSFCINCGQALANPAAMRRTAERQAPRVCPSCGQADELSQVFCLHCGANMHKTMPSLPRRRTKATAAVPKPAVIERKLARSYKLPAVAVGALAGVGLAVVTVQSAGDKIAGMGNWPRQGLVIYALPARAQVTIEERSSKSLTTGTTGPGGSLSIPDLPPGFYRIKLAAPGCLPVVKDLQVEPDKAAVLGFPDRIELPPER